MPSRLICPRAPQFAACNATSFYSSLVHSSTQLGRSPSFDPTVCALHKLRLSSTLPTRAPRSLRPATQRSSPPWASTASRRVPSCGCPRPSPSNPATVCVSVCVCTRACVCVCWHGALVSPCASCAASFRAQKQHAACSVHVVVSSNSHWHGALVSVCARARARARTHACMGILCSLAVPSHTCIKQRPAACRVHVIVPSNSHVRPHHAHTLSRAGYITGLQCDVWRSPSGITTAIPDSGPLYKVRRAHAIKACMSCTVSTHRVSCSQHARTHNACIHKCGSACIPKHVL